MKHIRATRSSPFKVLAQTRAAQAAMMVLPPGHSTGEPDNEHPRAEQWLFVVAGSGRAVVAKHKVTLRAGSLLLIEKGEIHRIVNAGTTPLITVSFYVPPAYTESGEVKQAAKK